VPPVTVAAAAASDGVKPSVAAQLVHTETTDLDFGVEVVAGTNGYELFLSAANEEDADQCVYVSIRGAGGATIGSYLQLTSGNASWLIPDASALGRTWQVRVEIAKPSVSDTL